MKRRVVEIRYPVTGELMNLDNMEFTWVGKDMAYGHIKGYGFRRMYSAADGFKVITEEA